MTRDQLERKLWLALRDLHADRNPIARNVVDNILDAADLYVITRRDEIRTAMAASDTPLNTLQRRMALAREG